MIQQQITKLEIFGQELDSSMNAPAVLRIFEKRTDVSAWCDKRGRFDKFVFINSWTKDMLQTQYRIGFVGKTMKYIKKQENTMIYAPKG